MRTEQEMFDMIMDVARKDDRIRAVYMNGSRTNPNVSRDIFQDYDIVYMVTETESFIKEVNWIKVFGEGLIIQKPDEMDRLLGKECDFKRSFAYLMQFADGNRIDLSIKTQETVLEEILADKLTITLLDKDHILPELPEPTDEDYWVKKPDKELFYCCCNEFYWVLLYIGKGLWREELLYAIDHLNFYVRPQLLKMLSWYAGILTDFSCSVGKNGKYLSKYIPEDTYQSYLGTFPRAETDSIWEAVFRMCELFEEMAVIVSEQLNFTYDKKEAGRCVGFMRHIRQLPKDAKEII